MGVFRQLVPTFREPVPAFRETVVTAKQEKQQLRRKVTLFTRLFAENN